VTKRIKMTSAEHDRNICQTCGARGNVVHFEGGEVYAYACSSEIVVFRDVATVVKKCPDFSNTRGERRKEPPG
jgi:hypothetical protein